MSFKTFFLMLSLCWLSACGEDAVVRSRSSYYGNQLSTPWLMAQFRIPAQGVSGSAITVELSGKSYLVGSQTPTNIKHFIQSLPAGTVQQFEITGQTARESGHFPNPSATFDVIHIQTIR
jgi:hypothetical protein